MAVRRVMHRRGFLRGAAGLGLVATGVPLLAACSSRTSGVAKPNKRRMPRVAYLSSDTLVTNTGLALDSGIFRDEFAKGLQDLGYVDGKSIAVDYHFTENDSQHIEQLAYEAVGQSMDVLVAADTPALEAVRKATSTIPIVAAFLSDPLSTGAVASLARPGGNVTGLTLIAPGLNAKELQIFKSTLPAMSRVGVIWNTTLQEQSQTFTEIANAAPALGVQIVPMGVQGNDDFDAAHAAGLAAGIEGVVYVLDSVVINGGTHEIPFVRDQNLPSVCNARGWAANGGLMSYSSDAGDLYRRVAGYVVRVLRGANPAVLPVERPTRFDLVINLAAARELGVTIPESVLVQATEVIQ